MTLRLNGIDAPEGNQAFAREAKKFLTEIVGKKTLRIVTRGTDKYGRTIADVYQRDGTKVNYELGRKGFAWWFRRYSGDTELQRLEKEARAAKRGLWADPNPIPAWEWRQQHRPK